MCELFQFFSIGPALVVSRNVVEVIPIESLLGIFMPQDHLVLLDVLNLSIFRNAFFVVAIILLNGLRY